MIILGLDHGNSICGYGVVDGEEGRQFKYVEHGFIRETKVCYPESLVIYPNKFKDLILRVKPGLVAFEGPNDTRGFLAHKKLVEILGCMKRVAVELGIPFVEIPPTTLKKIVTGNGYAAKEDVARRLSDIFNIPFEDLVEVTYYKQGLKAGQIKSYLADGSDALGLAVSAPVYLKRGKELDYNGR